MSGEFRCEIAADLGPEGIGPVLVWYLTASPMNPITNFFEILTEPRSQEPGALLGDWTFDHYEARSLF